MLKIAITGNIASGKSVVENYLSSKGFKVFDTDKIAHRLLETSKEVKEMFSNFNILTDGNVDRNKLANIVFSDKKQLKRLENIIHPLVKNELVKIFDGDEHIIFVSVPQLFEAGFEELFDKIILITADDNIRLERLMKRNNLSQEKALLRIKSQMPQEEKKEKADYIIKNEDSTVKLKQEIDNILIKLNLSSDF